MTDRASVPDDHFPERASAPNQENLRDIPVDWEALEDAFENNAPEVHSFLHLVTGDVLRVVDGLADPQMHARINADSAYLRIAPVSSREQYRWMERFIPLVEDNELRMKLASSIDGKGAFRRFKDTLMSHATERELWFAFRSERLRTFMEAWLTAHALHPVHRAPPPPAPSGVVLEHPVELTTALSEPQESREARRQRTMDTLRKQLRETAEILGPRDLESLTAFAEFLRTRRALRAHVHTEQLEGHGSMEDGFLGHEESGADAPEERTQG